MHKLLFDIYCLVLKTRLRILSEPGAFFNKLLKSRKQASSENSRYKKHACVMPQRNVNGASEVQLHSALSSCKNYNYVRSAKSACFNKKNLYTPVHDELQASCNTIKFVCKSLNNSYLNNLY